MAGPARAHVWVSGRVQGVFFRQTMATRARELGVAGWACNLADGRVEAVLEGDREAVDRILGWCEQGPPGARVESLEVRWEPPAGEPSGFRVRG